MKVKRIIKKIVFYLLLFYIGSIIGYIYEMLYCILIKGHITNRGALFGPWLPIYGIGVCLLTIISKIKDKKLLTIILTFLSMGTVEYLIGLLSLKVFHKRYWDYRDEPFNIDGIICLESLLAFTIGGLIFIYILYPLYKKYYYRIKDKYVYIIDICLSILFIIDIVMTSVIKYIK